MSATPGENPTLQGAPSQAAAPAPAIPSDYEELRAFRDNYAPTIEAISPYIDDIRPIIESEEDREFWREAKRIREEQKKAAAPKYSPEMQAFKEEILNTFGPLAEDFRNTKAQNEAAAKAQAEAAQRSNLEYAQRLIAERPDLAEDNYAKIGMVTAYAAQRGLSLEEAWKVRGSDFSAPTQRATPPRSLRGDQAAPGVPSESKPAPIKSQKDLHARLVANMTAGRKG